MNIAEMPMFRNGSGWDCIGSPFFPTRLNFPYFLFFCWPSSIIRADISLSCAERDVPSPFRLFVLIFILLHQQERRFGSISSAISSKQTHTHTNSTAIRHHPQIYPRYSSFSHRLPHFSSGKRICLEKLPFSFK